jgi:hypothetical protein
MADHRLDRRLRNSREHVARRGAANCRCHQRGDRPAALAKRREGRQHDVHTAEHVGVDLRAQARGVDLVREEHVDVRPGRDDDRVEPAELGDDGPNVGRRRVRMSHVEPVHRGAGAGVRHRRARPFGPLDVPAIGEGDVEAVAGEARADRRADPAAAAGPQRDGSGAARGHGSCAWSRGITFSAKSRMLARATSSGMPA